MKRIIPGIAAYALMILAVLPGCKKDEDPVTFTVNAGVIDDEEYTAGGTLLLMFSTDDGSSWVSDPGRVEEGTVVMVKVTSGDVDLTSDNFEFDWSASEPVPANPTDDVAVFQVEGTLTVSVKVTDILDLVVVKRSDGTVHSVNTSTGQLTLKGMIVYDSEPLAGLRGLVYDPATGMCYSGATAQGNGCFYSVNMKTGEATLLNNNIEFEWDGIADLILAPDGNIMGVIYSGIESCMALITFNKATGAAGTHFPIMYDSDRETHWSSGGLTYGSSDDNVIVGAWGEVLKAGTNGQISHFISLQSTTNIDATSAALMDLETARDGTIYAMVWDESKYDQGLVTLDVATGAMTETGLLMNGETRNDLSTHGYHCLAFVPRHILPEFIPVK
ncbi:MAG: hypothetical protein ACP5D1_09010 [Bacteroidales bacterium]